MHIKQKSNGFTIVELLIVVVVIAILAAITIVSYNGISKRATESSIKNELSSAATVIANDKTLSSNESYPANLDSANGAKGLRPSDGSDYQYSVNNAVNPKTYCLTITKAATSFYIDQTGTIKPNGCPGHGANGVASITNYSTNPTLAGQSGVMWGGAGSPTPSTPSTGGPVNNGAYYRITFPATTTLTSGNLSVQSDFEAPLTSGTYMFSAYSRASWIMDRFLTVEAYDADFTLLSTASSTPAAATLNAWQRYSLAVTLPAGTRTFMVYVKESNIIANRPVAGSTFDIANFMITKGTTLYTYADGDSPGWAWNAQEYSPAYRTSSGIPLP